MCLRDGVLHRLWFGVLAALTAVLASASLVGAAPVRVAIYDVAEGKVSGHGSEFGQIFRSPCDGSLVSVSVTDRSKQRAAEPVRVTISVHEGDRFSDRIGPSQTVAIDNVHPVRTAEWKPGEVPLRAGFSYYLRLVGNCTWQPAMHKKRWGRQPYRSGCAFADDGAVVIPQPDHDLSATIVVETEPARALVRDGADARRVVNVGGSDLWVIGAGDGDDAASVIERSAELMVLGQGEAAPTDSPTVAWLDGSRNLLRNGNFEFGYSYWRRCPDAPAVHGTDVTLSRSERSRFRDKSTYRVSLPWDCPAGTNICVSSSPVSIKPDTEYYLGGVCRSDTGAGVEARLNAVESSTDGLSREQTLISIGHRAAWRPFGQGFRTGPLTDKLTIKLTLTAGGEKGGEVLWDALYLVAADDVKVARAVEGDGQSGEPAAGPLAQGLNALRLRDRATSARLLTQVITESPASAEARQAMHHLLDPWATEADASQAWADWRRAMLRVAPPARAEDDGKPDTARRDYALAYLRMGHVLASRDAAEERLAECFQRAMVNADESSLAVEAAESARRCCASRDKAMAILRQLAGSLAYEGEPWLLFQAAVFEKNAGQREQAIATLTQALDKYPQSAAAPAASALLGRLRGEAWRVEMARATDLYFGGERERGIEALERLLEAYPDVPEAGVVCWNIACGHRAAKRHCEAAEWYEKAAEKWERYRAPTCLMAAAECWHKCGQRQRALELLRDGMRKFPDQAREFRIRLAALEAAEGGAPE